MTPKAINTNGKGLKEGELSEFWDEEIVGARETIGAVTGVGASVASGSGVGRIGVGASYGWGSGTATSGSNL